MSAPASATLPGAPGRSPGRSRAGARRFARALSWVAVATSLVVLLTSVAAYGFTRYLGSQIKTLSFTVDGPRPKEVTPSVNFLLAGSDTRVGQDAGFQGSGDAYVTGQRSDSVLLVHVSARPGDITVLSFPRDSYVMIPEYTDPTTKAHYSLHRDKLNVAFSEGGPALLIQTIEQFTGLPVDHFVDVDFSQFKDIVNSLGGIEVCLTQPARESNSGINLPAGRQTINGDQALAFVRQRYGLPASDLDRINRQQRFLASVVRKLSSSGVLLNPQKLVAFATSVSRSITVDSKTNLDDLVQLAQRLQGLSTGGVKFITLPVTELGYQTPYSGLAVLPDGPADTALFQSLYDDDQIGPAVSPTPSASASASPSASPTPSPSGPALIVAPGNITVNVRNDSGVSGRAVQALQDLVGVGFRAGTPQNGTAGKTQTEVHYPSTLADSARTVAAAIPGSVLVADSEVQSILVEVGSGYTGVQTVSVAGSSTSTPTTPTTDSPAPLATSTTAPLTAATADCGV